MDLMKLIAELKKVDERFYVHREYYDDYDWDAYIRYKAPGDNGYYLFAIYEADQWEMCRNEHNIPTVSYYKGMKVIAEFMLEIEGRKKAVVPLPRLKTQNGQQLYLSYEDGCFYPAIRDERLNQEWAKKDIDKIPKEYRQYIEEV